MAFLQQCLVVSIVVNQIHGQVMFPIKSFGTAMKACYTAPAAFTNTSHLQGNWSIPESAFTSCVPWPMDSELPVFSWDCQLHGGARGACLMNHFWSGGNWKGYQNIRLRYYVDGETKASVDYPVGLGHGSVMIDDDGPWSAGGTFGKTGEPSGIFNTYPIPFFENITVTVELVSSPTTTGDNRAQAAATQRFWIILRGHVGMGQSIGLPGSSLHIPGNSRLRTTENTVVVKKDGDQLVLFNSSVLSGAGRSGAVFMVTLSVNAVGGGETFLEGCLRAYKADGTFNFLLSSGTEDYFLGTYYFNKGKYMNPVAGLTHLDTQGNTSFSAYRVHTDDPLAYETAEGMVMTWRNGDPEGCDLSTTRGGPAVRVSSLVFAYDWD